MVRIGSIELGDFPLLLAPMEDITDPPFRAVCKKMGADLMFSEFISSEGLIRDALKSRVKLQVREEERPMAIQIFGHDIESMKKATAIAEAASPDIIDINFGCPVRKVVARGAGAGILNDPDKMIRLTGEVVKSTTLPVTVKTRLGWDEEHQNIVEISERLQDAGIKAISIHGRTRAQLYRGNADWKLIGSVKNNPRMHIPVFGNGDVTSAAIALEMKLRYPVDGIMIGRAAVGYPWIFRETRHLFATGNLLPPPALEERIALLKEHLQASVDFKGERRTAIEMRKFYSGYFREIPDVKKYRSRLVVMEDIREIFETLEEMLHEFAPGELNQL